MKFISFITLIFICSGCPIYDPPDNELTIHNYSDKAIYIAYGCSEHLNPHHKLKLFEVYDGKYILDEYGQHIKDTIFPDYRINAYAFGKIKGFGGGRPSINCNDSLLYLFIIKESVMRNQEWNIICQNKLYERLEFSQKQLDSLHWKIPYSY